MTQSRGPLRYQRTVRGPVTSAMAEASLYMTATASRRSSRSRCHWADTQYARSTSLWVVLPSVASLLYSLWR